VTENDLKALVEAGRAAATETFEAMAKMGECELAPLAVVAKADANGTNSLDVDFFQSLIDGAHLNEQFLHHAAV
jgi:hypothetical protein